MNYTKIDKVILEFFSFLPYGGNYYDATHNFNFEYLENDAILKFLVDNEILDDWGQHGKHIISEKGLEIVKIYGGIEKYLQHEKEEKDKENRLKELQNEKLFLDTKLSKWQVKVFWYVFIFGMLGGIYTVYSIIDSFVGESEAQKIERILENKLKEREQKQQTSTYQTSIDTLSKVKPGKK